MAFKWLGKDFLVRELKKFAVCMHVWRTILVRERSLVRGRRVHDVRFHFHARSQNFMYVRRTVRKRRLVGPAREMSRGATPIGAIDRRD